MKSDPPVDYQTFGRILLEKTSIVQEKVKIIVQQYGTLVFPEKKIEKKKKKKKSVLNLAKLRNIEWRVSVNVASSNSEQKEEVRVTLLLVLDKSSVEKSGQEKQASKEQKFEYQILDLSLNEFYEFYGECQDMLQSLV